MKLKLIKLYFQLFWTTFDRDKFDEGLTEHRAHFLFCAALIFVPILLGYVIISFLFINKNLVWQIGLVCLLLHVTLIFFLKSKKRLSWVVHTILIGAFLFQITFSLFSGGIYSPALIWATILPIISGLVLDRKSLISWIVSVNFVFLFFIISQGLGLKFPILLTAEGLYWATSLLVCGWGITAAGLIYTYLHFIDRKEKIIKQMNEESNGLIRVVCHDILNPTNVVVLCAQTLKKEMANEKIDRILRAGNRITNIISGVKTLQSIINGKTQFNLTRVNFKESLMNTLQLFEESLLSKNLKVEMTNVQENAIQSDQNLLENQILGNLISNSIKFSFTGSKIEFSFYKLNDEESVFMIKDHGAGIPKLKIPILFDPSFPTTTLGTSGETGTGFGMPIVKSCLDYMNSKISIESNTEGSDRGTIVKVFFKNFDNNLASI